MEINTREAANLPEDRIRFDFGLPSPWFIIFPVAEAPFKESAVEIKEARVEVL